MIHVQLTVHIKIILHWSKYSIYSIYSTEQSQTFTTKSNLKSHPPPSLSSHHLSTSAQRVSLKEKNLWALMKWGRPGTDRPVEWQRAGTGTEQLKELAEHLLCFKCSGGKSCEETRLWVSSSQTYCHLLTMRALLGPRKLLARQK